jgi:hypothetical protein
MLSQKILNLSQPWPYLYIFIYLFVYFSGLKGIQVRDFQSLRLLWYLHHEASLCGQLWDFNKTNIFFYLCALAKFFLPNMFRVAKNVLL